MRLYKVESVSQEMLQKASTKFNTIMVELGLRETNYHCGSGLGGNNFQLMVLMGLNHKLIDSIFKIEVHNNDVFWGADWLINASIADIRAELDARFDSILEKNKYLALSLKILGNHPNDLRQAFQEHKDQFPLLSDFLDNKSIELPVRMSNWEKLIAAFIACQDLAFDLDKGENKRITAVANLLLQVPPETMLLSVRKYIQINRAVKHNLDMHSDFVKVIDTVNKTLQ